MKIFKQRGFSLAEMLIAMGIASTIIFLGFTMSKKSIENAYKGYIYTGYHGISTAIKEAKVEGIEPKPDDSKDFAIYIEEILDADMKYVSDYYEITAPNKIKYIIKKSAISWEGTSTTPEHMVYIIKMQTPTKKQQNKTHETICLAYNPTKYDVLLPFSNIPDVCQSTIDIKTRPDYLLFYLDNGTAGKTIQGNYNEIKYMSVEDAVCKQNKDITVYYITPAIPSGFQKIYDCDDTETKDTSSIIKYANPLKRLAK
ncbi:type II secretion system protein [bacterium]|nr:type II secretion system protein [bacterium]